MVVLWGMVLGVCRRGSSGGWRVGFVVFLLVLLKGMLMVRVSVSAVVALVFGGLVGFALRDAGVDLLFVVVVQAALLCLVFLGCEAVLGAVVSELRRDKGAELVSGLEGSTPGGCSV